MNKSEKTTLFLAVSLLCSAPFAQDGRVKGQMIVHQATTTTPTGLQMNADLSTTSLATIDAAANRQTSIDSRPIQKGKADEVISGPSLVLTPAADNAAPPAVVATPVPQSQSSSTPPMPGVSVQGGQVQINSQSIPPASAPKTDQSTPRTKQKLPPASVALPQPSTKQTILPGIGVLPGDQPAKANVLRIQENVTEEVPVSSLFPNRIATPFPNPKVIDSSDSAIKQDGSNIFISTSSKEPVAIFITSDRSGDPVISLLLKPAPIPPQSVVLQLDARIKPSSTAQAQEQMPDTYTGSIVHILKQIALGQVPAGMSGGPLPVSVGQMGDLLLATESRYSGRSVDVFTYWIENRSDKPIVLDESYFYTSQAIRAVSFYPISQLKPKEGTRLMIVSETAEGIGRE